jgi:hypothetical protein
MPWVSQRHMLFFALTALLVGGPHIGSAWERWMPVRPSARPRPAWAIVLPALAALLLLAIQPPNLSSIPFSDPEKYPLGATALLNESGVSGNLANHANWGNYLAWHLAPPIKISLDSRFEQAYPLDIYWANLRFMLGVGKWDSLLQDYPTDMVLIDAGSPADNLMKLRTDWEEIYRDAASALYARRGSPQAERLRQTASAFQPPPVNKTFP